MDTSYCLKCKKQTKNLNFKSFITKNNRYMLKSNCNNSKQNIIAKTSMNTKTDKIEKLSKTLLFPSSALLIVMFVKVRNLNSFRKKKF